MPRPNSNRLTAFVTCENCLYSDTLGIFYDANKYCVVPRPNSNRLTAFVTCENCLYSDTLGIFYDANKVLC